MNMLRNFDRRQIAMDFLCLSGEAGAYASEIESLGGRIILCRLNRFDILGFSKRFINILSTGEYDVVHSHVLTFSGLLLWLAERADIPQRLAHFHTSKVTTEGRSDGILRRVYIWTMRRFLERSATRFLACSKVAMEAVASSREMSKKGNEVLYYGIELSPYQKTVDTVKVRKEFGIPLDAKVVGHVGRFLPAKNHDFIVQVAKKLCQSRSDIRFLLVGDGELRDEIERDVRNKGLSSFFIFTGVRDDVPLLMKTMNLFILPSLREGLGIVLVEAQAAGLPIITSQLPVIQEVVFTPLSKDLPLRSPMEWADACEELLETNLTVEKFQKVWQKLGRFSSEKCSARLIEIYSDGSG